MVDINSTISIITSNVNGLNTDRDCQNDQKMRSNYMSSIRTHFKYKDTYRLKIKGWRKIYHANTNHKEVGVAIFLTEPTLEQGKLSGTEALHNSKGVNSQRRQQSLTCMCLTTDCQNN